MYNENYDVIYDHRFMYDNIIVMIVIIISSITIIIIIIITTTIIISIIIIIYIYVHNSQSGDVNINGVSCTEALA